MVPPSAKATSRSPQRSLLAVGVLLLCALALAPVLSLGWFAFDAGEGSRFDLGYGGTEQVLNTLALVALVGLLTAVLGTATGWLTARCAFPGRRWLRIAQLLPLATPSYLLAATWIDLGSRYGLRVHGFTPTLIVMVLSTYSYVFLLSTESFSVSGRRQLEACRSLGVGPWGSFWRVALPMALPAIGAGVALGGMEVVNELGAVQLLGVPTLSTGILNRWQQDGDPQGAVALALMALVIVALLVGAERNLRQRSRCWNLGNDGDADPQWGLVGQRRWLSQALCLLPPLITLGLPVIWAGLSWDQMRAEDTTELLALGSRSFGLALLAAALTVGGGLLLAIAKRWIPNAVLQRLTFISGLGYAIPGTVLALVDAQGNCHGFGRIRPCLLHRGEGWRIGPLMAETPEAAARLLQGLLHRHAGVVLIDAPAANAQAPAVLEQLGFSPLSETLRMYRGEAPAVSLQDVYGLACLELG